LRARQEQTQLEDLSDASFLGKLLVLPARANARQDWKKESPCTNTLAYLALSSATKEKSFITLTPDVNVFKLSLFATNGDKSKLGRLTSKALTGLFNLV
jgi:hypothetical protein